MKIKRKRNNNRIKESNISREEKDEKKRRKVRTKTGEKNMSAQKGKRKTKN